MTTLLDTRTLRITRWLLQQNQPRSTAALASELGLSQRVVRYRLDQVERFLRSCGAELARKRGQGLLIDASPDVRTRIVSDIQSLSQVPRVYTPLERERILLAALLWEAPGIVSLEDLHLELEVSKTSARRDLQRCEPWLERNGLPLVRRAGQGICVVGTERRLRRATVQLILEAIPEEVLQLQLADDPEAAQQATARVPVGLLERIFTLPLAESAAIIRSSTLGQTLTAGRSDAVFALYLAVSVARVQTGCNVAFDAGSHRSAMDHPVARSVATIVPSLERLLGTSLPAAEVAAITEYLLGLDALDAERSGSDAIGGDLLDEIMRLAGDRLHSSLVEDAELRRGLTSHLERLDVRLRYGLPIHNPLLDEVRERYPDVYVVATEMASRIAKKLRVAIADDEIGFITMYVSGAMERARLRPRRRALVVCPSGMATVWVLVSRIKSEFPGLDLVEVLSESGFEEISHADFDLVISTVPLGHSEVTSGGREPALIDI